MVLDNIRKSQVYDHLRSERLSPGVYVVEVEVTGRRFIIFKHPDGNWKAVDLDNGGQHARTKMELMRQLEKDAAKAERSGAA